MQNSFSYERFHTWTRFETEAQENSEIAYLTANSFQHFSNDYTLTDLLPFIK